MSNIEISGRVSNAEGHGIAGAAIYLRRKQFVLSRGRPCFAVPDPSSAPIAMIPIGIYQLIELMRAYPTADTDLARIQIPDSLALGVEQAWICARQQAEVYADWALARDAAPVGHSGEDGAFAIHLSEAENLMLRVVHRDHFDYASPEINSYPAVHDVVLEPAVGAIDETGLVGHLGDFAGFGYFNGAGKFPSGYGLGLVGPGYIASSTADRYNDCATFTCALLCKSWRDARGVSFTWTVADHRRWMVNAAIIDAQHRMTALQGAIDRQMGDLVQIVEVGQSIGADRAPPPWSLVQGFKTVPSDAERWASGHSFIIVEHHPQTDRVLMLESNGNPQTAGAPWPAPDNGPRFRGLDARAANNHIDHYRDSQPSYSPGPAWWRSPSLPTWTTLRSQYPYRVMVRLRVNNLTWVV